MNSLHIYTERNSSRLSYVVGHLFHNMLGLDVFIHDHHERIEDAPCIWYGQEYNTHPGFINIYAEGLLYRNGPEQVNPEVMRTGPDILIYPAPDQRFEVPMDIFSATFLLLSRMEEYGHEGFRFDPTKSLNYKEGFLMLPVIDVWAHELGNMLTSGFPGLQVKRPSFSLLPTYDIDHAWAFRNKSIFKKIGGTIRDILTLSIPSLSARMKTWFLRHEDPYFTFRKLWDVHSKSDSKPMYFFLMGPETKLSLSPKVIGELKDVILACSKQGTIGIHPSRSSNENQDLLKSEIDSLSETSDQTIMKSRQHYLEMRLPQTYRILIENGILEDYTMGYAEEVGFRAGTSMPFKWYDLEREEATDLTIVPFCVMDQTLKQYLSLTPQQAMILIDELMDSLKQVNGQFTFIWHNSSLSKLQGWQPWIQVYHYLTNIQE